MRVISDETLLESYWKALDLQLDVDFVNLLLMEIKRRDLSVENRASKEMTVL